MLLEGKNAVIYGAGGLGAGVARTFAREGASVFLAGRTREPLEALAADVAAAGGSAEATVLDALSSGPSTRTSATWSPAPGASTSRSTSPRARTVRARRCST